MSFASRRVALAVGDVLSLVVFTVIGLIRHEGGVKPGGVLEVVLPIVAVGALASQLFGTYRRPGLRTLLPTWLVAVPAGILIRRTLFHEPSTFGSLGVFLCIALAFTLLFLLAWRVAARFLLGVELSGRSPSFSAAP